MLTEIELYGLQLEFKTLYKKLVGVDPVVSDVDFNSAAWLHHEIRKLKIQLDKKNVNIS